MPVTKGGESESEGCQGLLEGENPQLSQVESNSDITLQGQE